MIFVTFLVVEKKNQTSWKIGRVVAKILMSGTLKRPSILLFLLTGLRGKLTARTKTSLTIQEIVKNNKTAGLWAPILVQEYKLLCLPSFMLMTHFEKFLLSNAIFSSWTIKDHEVWRNFYFIFSPSGKQIIVRCTKKLDSKNLT